MSSFNQKEHRARICKRFRSPCRLAGRNVKSKFPISLTSNRVVVPGPLGWESILGFLKIFTTTGSGPLSSQILRLKVASKPSSPSFFTYSSFFRHSPFPSSPPSNFLTPHSSLYLLILLFLFLFLLSIPVRPPPISYSFSHRGALLMHLSSFFFTSNSKPAVSNS